jgi:hypothetical protein
MRKLVSQVLAISALIVLTVSVAFAAPDDKKKTKMPTCPDCKMELTAKKDKMHTTAVKIGKKTYYCCDKCPMASKKKK